jgi:hypothetical protein
MSEDETSLLRRNEMQYTLMFYMSPSEFSARTDPKNAAFWGAFLPYMQAVRDAGIFKNGAGLGPPEIATTVRVQNGKRAVQHGHMLIPRSSSGASSSSRRPI